MHDIDWYIFQSQEFCNYFLFLQYHEHIFGNRENIAINENKSTRKVISQNQFPRKLMSLSYFKHPVSH